MERTGSMIKVRTGAGRPWKRDYRIRGLCEGRGGGRGLGLIKGEGKVGRFRLLVFAWGLTVQPWQLAGSLGNLWGRGQEESWFSCKLGELLEFTQDGEHSEPKDSILFSLSAYLTGAVTLQYIEVKNMILKSWSWTSEENTHVTFE